MANCCKRVVYLSCLEFGSKAKRAGFIKVESQEGEWIFDMHISGMTECPERKYEIYAVDKVGEEYGIGSVFLHRGCGEWKWRGKRGTFGKKEISGDEIARFVVKISENKAIEGRLQEIGLGVGEKAAGNGSERARGEKEGGWRKTARPEFRAAEKWKEGDTVSKPSGIAISEDKKESSKECQGKRIFLAGRREDGRVNSWEQEGKQQEERQEEKRNLHEGEREENKRWEEQRPEEGRQRESIGLGRRHREAYERTGERTKEDGKRNGKGERGVRMEEMILNNKWEQLRQMYPVIHPYEDEREYISIEPKDFVIMTGDYQHLANNSFLLHGFYNYRHIVLGRESVHEEEVGAAEADKNRAWNERQRTERDTGIKEMNGVRNEDAMGDFYLGVPGVYYEREKMVALMFGFEAFECIGGKAESGKFGYYLRRVKI
ncbi:MAG: hypothetical protein HFI01_00620 [Lachnospiraceae bacterium]|nr:hypothetical protein [Lachnospiraceae bacterium]